MLLQFILLSSFLLCNSLMSNKLQQVVSLKNNFFGLRHGQSIANVANIISSDPAISTVEHGLSDLGKEQVSTSAQAFVRNFEKTRYNGVAIFSSDFKRARETSEIFAKQIIGADIPLYGGNLIKEIRLRERFFGDFNGQSDEHYEDVWNIDCVDPNHTKFNVESVNSVVERTSSLIIDLEEEFKTEGDKPYQIILAAHGDVLQILQTAFLKKDGSEHRSLEHLETAAVREMHLAK